MDELLIFARNAKESCAFQGSTEEFKRSPELVDWCIKHRRIIRLSPQEMSREERERYTDYLAELMREYLKAHPEVKNWSAFASRSGTNKVQALFHQFGVRGEVFGIESFQEEELEQPARPQTNLTIEEFYEMCQIQFHYEGSLEIRPETPVSGRKNLIHVKLVYDDAGLATKPNSTCSNKKY